MLSLGGLAFTLRQSPLQPCCGQFDQVKAAVKFPRVIAVRDMIQCRLWRKTGEQANRDLIARRSLGLDAVQIVLIHRQDQVKIAEIRSAELARLQFRDIKATPHQGPLHCPTGRRAHMVAGSPRVSHSTLGQRARNPPSAAGERQILPRQTNRIFLGF